MSTLSPLLIVLALSAAPPPSSPASAPPSAPPAVTPFRVVVLGAQGGLTDGDLTSFLIGKPGKKSIALDAGTFVNGIDVARAKGAFPGDASTAVVMKERIGEVLITHPHYDHIVGLVIASPDDVQRPLLGLPSTIEAIRDHVFNGSTWANFGNEGNAPALNRYRYVRMTPGVSLRLDDAGVDVTAYPLSHAGGTSTAFVIDDGAQAIVYLGDTGADDVERSDKLAAVLTRTAALVRGHRLAALFIEASYPSARDDGKLFGHLTPRHVLAALRMLARDVDLQHPEHVLAGVNVVITHIKPSLEAGGKAPRDVIAEELPAKNDLGVRFFLPRQGDVLSLSAP